MKIYFYKSSSVNIGNLSKSIKSPEHQAPFSFEQFISRGSFDLLRRKIGIHIVKSNTEKDIDDHFNFGGCYSFARKTADYLISKGINARVRSIFLANWNEDEEYHDYELVHSFITSRGIDFDISGPIEIEKIRKTWDNGNTIIIDHNDPTLQKSNPEMFDWIHGDFKESFEETFLPKEENANWKKVFNP